MLLNIMKRLFRKLYLHWLQEDLDEYKDHVFDRPDIAHTTKHHYYDQAKAFVKWMRDQDIKPYTDDEL